MFLSHLSARLKVWMSKRARSLQKLLHMIPPTIPVTATVPVSTIHSHSENNTTRYTDLALHLMLDILAITLYQQKSSVFAKLAEIRCTIETLSVIRVLHTNNVSGSVCVMNV